MSEIGTRPTRELEWATDAGAEKTDPGLPKCQDGWESGDIPPRQGANWWRNLVYQWVEFVDDNNLVFDELGAMIAAVPAGSSAAVDEYDPSKPFFDTQQFGQSDSSSADGDGSAVDTDGSIVVVGDDDGYVVAYGRDDFTYANRLWSVQPGGSNIVNDISVCGGDVYVVKGNSVYQLIRATGATNGSYSHDRPTTGCYTDGNKLYIAGQYDATKKSVEQLPLDLSGTPTSAKWDYTEGTGTGGDAKKVVTDGERVYVAGEMSQTNNYVLRVLSYSFGHKTSYALTGNTRHGIDLCLSSDFIILVSEDDAPTDRETVHAFPKYAESVAIMTGPIWANGDQDGAQCCVCDDRRVYVGSTYSPQAKTIRVFDLRTGYLVYTYLYPGATSAGDDVRGICADDFRVTIAYVQPSTPPDDCVRSLNIQRKPGLARRLDAGNQYRQPNHLLAAVERG